MSAASAAPALQDEVEAWVTCQPDLIADRWGLYARLRSEAPVYRHKNQVFVARYDDASRMLIDEEHFKKNGAGQLDTPRVKHVLDLLDAEGKQMLREIFEHRGRWISSSDDERHTYLRGLGTRIFSPRAIAEMEERIEDLGNEMLTGFAKRSSFEVISELAFSLPLTIVSEMLDIPPDARTRIHDAWVAMMGIEAAFSDLSRVQDTLPATYEGHVAMDRELKMVLDINREDPKTELLRSLFRAEAEGGVNEVDLIGVVSQIINAGHQTTQDLIGNSIYTLLTHRDQWDLLIQDPSLVGNAIEEVLRFRSPAQMMSRYVAVDAEVGGEPVRPGEFCVALLGCANHDEDYFPDPEVFSITRENARHHLAFSRGTHFCLGAALSRLEARTLIGTLARRFPEAHVVQREDEIVWEQNTFLLSLAALQVALGPDCG